MKCCSTAWLATKSAPNHLFEVEKMIEPTILPKQFQKPTFRFVKVHSFPNATDKKERDKRKVAFENGWNTTANYAFDDPELVKWRERGENVGLLNGPGNIIAVDKDHRAMNNYLSILPETITTASGREDHDTSWFICDDVPEGTRNFIPVSAEDGTHCGEIRLKKVQTLCPGSLHVSGNRYHITKDLPDFTKISWAQIKDAFPSDVIDGAPKKDVGLNDEQRAKFREMSSQITEAMTIPETVPDQFRSPNLLHEVFLVLDVKHKGDDSQKMLIWITLANAKRSPKKRFSVRVIGNSSDGKDDAIDTSAEHIPKTLYEKITSESEKYFERAETLPPAVNFGELNLATADKQRVELVKALSEGGSSYAYLDDFGKTEKKIKIPRHTGVYSTTEVAIDDELSTRYITASVKGSVEQTQEVLGYYGKTRSDPEKALFNDANETSWIAAGVDALKDYHVFIPYALAVTNAIDSKYSRARRDGRKLLDFIEAITILHQFQRPKYTHAENELLVATPCDLKYALEILDDTLNQSYNAIEPRLQKAIQVVERETKQILEKDGPGAPTWLQQRDLVKKLGIRDKGKALAIFDRLEELLVIDRQKSETDKRAWEVRLTGKTGIPLLTRDRAELLEQATKAYNAKLDELGRDKITLGTRQFIDVKPVEVFPNDD